MQKIQIYDTTLRDGSQGEGISFSVQDKVRIASKLDELGVDFIEGGWPGANPKEDEFFSIAAKSLKLKRSKLVAFGSTRRVGVAPAKDIILKGLLKAETKYVTIFGKSWDLHVKTVLRAPLSENTKMIYDSVKFLKDQGRKVIFDAEHFFDGYNENPNYAIEAIKAAHEAGAECLVLCDTNGGTMTSRIFEVVEEVKAQIKASIGIHTHNDSEMAVANSVAAVQAGCVHVQGTFNGYGERCGNADLTSVIPIVALKLKQDCIRPENLEKLLNLSRFVSETANMTPINSRPFV
ncbi:MAG: citramalate synthase, partial [Candidatus Omnitrophica bacterium]|nr:citramalate synthase [Candidatus Omnitrophota bacterium]